MSDLTRLLHAALTLEQHLDCLMAELHHLPNNASRRALLGRIEALRSQRHPLMTAWIEAALQDEQEQKENHHADLP